MSSDGGVWVGVVTFEVLTPGVHSLKEKRALILPIVERIRSRLSVSAARLHGLDRWDRETLAVAVVSNDPELCRKLLERVDRFARSFGLQIEATRLDVERWD